MSSTEERLAELEACMDRLLRMTEQGNEAMRKMLTIVGGEGGA